MKEEKMEEIVASDAVAAEGAAVGETPAKKEKSRKFDVSNVIMKGLTMIVLWALALSLAVPVIWMLYSSFKDGFEYLVNSFSLPKHWTFENYIEVVKVLEVDVVVYQKGIVTYGIGAMVGYSIVYTFGMSIMGVLMPAITSYALAKYKFPGSNILYSVGLVVMIIPIVGSMPSQMQIYKVLGIYDNLWLFMLVSAGPFGFNFFLLYGAWKSIPWDYAEAAYIDGGGHWTILFRIMFPMMIPTFTALFVLGFIGAWNDYQTPYIWLPSTPNMASGLFTFQGTASSLGLPMPTVLAGFVIVAIPSSVLFLLFQKIITSQFTIGGLKG